MYWENVESGETGVNNVACHSTSLSFHKRCQVGNNELLYKNGKVSPARNTCIRSYWSYYEILILIGHDLSTKKASCLAPLVYTLVYTLVASCQLFNMHLIIDLIIDLIIVRSVYMTSLNAREKLSTKHTYNGGR